MTAIWGCAIFLSTLISSYFVFHFGKKTGYSNGRLKGYCDAYADFSVAFTKQIKKKKGDKQMMSITDAFSFFRQAMSDNFLTPEYVKITFNEKEYKKLCEHLRDERNISTPFGQQFSLYGIQVEMRESE